MAIENIAYRVDPVIKRFEEKRLKGEKFSVQTVEAVINRYSVRIKYFADMVEEFNDKYCSTSDELLMVGYKRDAKFYNKALSITESECKPWRDRVAQSLNDKVNHCVNY